MKVEVFDAHCHLQDPRIFNIADRLIESACDAGVVRFAVNGTCEKDWQSVKQLWVRFPCTIPNFGLHPWFITERSANWFTTLKQYFEAVPAAAVGEIGLDKGSLAKHIDFDDQVKVFQQQLELAKELEGPASVHCVQAFGDLLQILKATGPFPNGVILHSYLGSAEMVPELADLGAYFSFSGHNMSMKEQKAKGILKMVPRERILLETDAPDALPKLGSDSLCSVGTTTMDIQPQPGNPSSDVATNPDVSATVDENETLNHPVNILAVLKYVARLLEMPPEELAEVTCRNAIRLFSYEGSAINIIVYLPNFYAVLREEVKVKVFLPSLQQLLCGGHHGARISS